MCLVKVYIYKLQFASLKIMDYLGENDTANSSPEIQGMLFFTSRRASQ